MRSVRPAAQQINKPTMKKLPLLALCAIVAGPNSGSGGEFDIAFRSDPPRLHTDGEQSAILDVSALLDNESMPDDYEIRYEFRVWDEGWRVVDEVFPEWNSARAEDLCRRIREHFAL